MTDQPENLVLIYLRRIDENVSSLKDDMREVKGRLGLLEEGYALVSRRVDRIELRLERIERRLDLVEVPAGH